MDEAAVKIYRATANQCRDVKVWHCQAVFVITPSLACQDIAHELRMTKNIKITTCLNLISPSSASKF